MVPLLHQWVIVSVLGLAIGPAGHPQPTAPVRRRTQVVEVFEATKDAVVNISATQIIQVSSPFGFGSLFEDLFDFPGGRLRRYKRESAGSGFVLHTAGYIVTNYHVVARTAERKVIFADKQEYEAQVIAKDPQRDLAILKIEADRELQPITLGRSNDLMVGETVIAIGNPLGYQHTVTAGIVSALNRQIDLGSEVKFTGLIQTDASINPGNSGGPLLNVLSELVGINTAIRADAQNIGFAIAVDSLREVLPEMLDVERRYRFLVGLRVANGDVARVKSVASGSPAATAGVKVNDQIVKVDEQLVGSAIDYHIALIGRQAGQPTPMTITRNGQHRQMVVVLGQLPRPDGARLLWQRFGIEATPIKPTETVTTGRYRLSGLLIQRIQLGSPADEANLRRGQIIMHVGRHRVTDIDDVGNLLEHVVSSQEVRFDVLEVRGRTLVGHTIGLRAR